MTTKLKKAPELQVEKWLNNTDNITIESLQGQAIMIVAFQMLCLGCVQLLIPQAKKVYDMFPPNDLTVIGIHTVFEHHEAMKEPSLSAFLHEYNIKFPVAIDQPSETGRLPKTMSTYNMQGTPTILLIDHEGYLRAHHFGHISDLQLGAELATLIIEKKDAR